MDEGVFWCDDLPAVTISGDGVHLKYACGDRRFGFRMSRANFRKCVEKGTRLLDEADAKETLLHFPLGRSG